MTNRFNIKWLWFLLAILIILLCISYKFFVTESFESSEKSFQDVTPEEVFQEYVWKDDIIPTEVKNINGVEGIVWFSSTGPAFVRFNAPQKFINKLVETKFSWL